jgi:hypothetical protein
MCQAPPWKEKPGSSCCSEVGRGLIECSPGVAGHVYRKVMTNYMFALRYVHEWYVSCNGPGAPSFHTASSKAWNIGSTPVSQVWHVYARTVLCIA